MIKHLTLAGLLAILLVSLPPHVAAQTFGEITGTVADTSGAVITGATVVVTNSSTSQERRVQTNETGNYHLPFLVPGTYDITAETEGFKSAARRNLVLQVGDVLRVNFELEVGVVTEFVEVQASSVALQTESTSVGTVIDNQRIVELPLNGRNFLSLVKLSPNVTAEMSAGGQAGDRQGGDRANQPISVAGQRQQFNRYTLDGVENTDVNFNTFIIRPSIDALQEFKVQTGVYSAEYGRATSQINATTRSGSNEIHGTVYEFHRNENLDAAEWLVTGEKNPFIRNQFGFTVGGPLIRNRLFFMSNFEALRDRTTSETRSTVAPARMRAGDFSLAGRDIYDPLTRVFETDAAGNEAAVSADQFPGNVIPQSRLHPISQQLLEFYPDPTIPGDDISIQNYSRDRPSPTSWEQFIQRIDFNENDSSQWFGRFSWGDEFVKRNAAFPQQEGRTTTKVYQMMLSNTRTLTPTIVNEFRAGYNQFQNDQLLHFAYERDVSAELGIPGLNSPVDAAWGTPSIGIGDGLSGFGESTEGPYVNRNHTFQVLDNIAIVRGSHTFKFGGEWSRRRFNQIGNQFPRGSFGFENQATSAPGQADTGFSFASFMIGESRRSERALGIANIQLRQSAAYFYAEDTWKVTPRLTVNLGIRYERTPAWYDKHRGIMNVRMFDPGVGPGGVFEGTQTPIFVRPGEGDVHEGILYHFHDGIPKAVGNDILGRGLVGDDNNDFAPRIGMSWSPTDRWVFRTGLGVFYTQDTGNPVFDMGRNLGGRGRFESNNERPNSNLTDPWAFERASFQCSNWDGVCLGPPYVLGNISSRRTPYVIQWIFNVQRQLTDSVLLEIGYQGSGGHKLQRLRAYNEAVNRFGPDDNRTIQQRSPWGDAYGRIQEVDGSVNSNYHGLSFKLQQRPTKGLTYLVGYTWSKSIDNGSAIRTNGGDRLFPPDSYDLKAERGLSQFHTGQRLVGSILYELPFRSDNGALNAILGGWQLGTILTFSEGTPINVGNIGDRNNTGDGNYPDATGTSPILDNPTQERFWDIGAFDQTNPALSWRPGSVGRNVLISPGTINWDFSAAKNFRITERFGLEFRFESFNFANHPNWNSPSTNIRSSVFGIVQSAGRMRTNQLGLKLIF